jgi:hypothetical protein
MELIQAVFQMRVYGRFFFSFASLFFLTLPAHSKPENCWKQHRATVHEWTCAGQSLPAEGQEFARSIVVVDSPKALMVIDSGAAPAVGESAAAAIRSRFGAKPVWVINSQAKAEHVLGNVGFRNVFAGTLPRGESFSNRVVAGKRTANLIRESCTTCIENFSERIESDFLKATESLIPGRVLQTKSGHLGLLQNDWVPWKFRFYSNLETEEALVLRNQALKLWWVGSLVQNRYIPDLYDGNVVERINFLGRLKARMGAGDTILTSFGVLGRDAIERNLNYFVRVQQAVLYGLEGGVSEVDLINQISAQIGEFKDRVIVQTDPRVNARALEIHQLNIQRIYRQTEEFVF